MTVCIDISNQLAEGFHAARMLWFRSAWEDEPPGMLDETTVRPVTDEEAAGIHLFERLRESSGAIPSPMIRRAEELYLFNRVETFEEILLMRTVHCGYVPEHATDLLETLNRSLPFVKVCHDQH